MACPPRGVRRGRCESSSGGAGGEERGAAGGRRWELQDALPHRKSRCSKSFETAAISPLNVWLSTITAKQREGGGGAGGWGEQETLSREQEAHKQWRRVTRRRFRRPAAALCSPRGDWTVETHTKTKWGDYFLLMSRVVCPPTGGGISHPAPVSSKPLWMQEAAFTLTSFFLSFYLERRPIFIFFCNLFFILFRFGGFFLHFRLVFLLKSVSSSVFLKVFGPQALFVCVCTFLIDIMLPEFVKQQIIIIMLDRSHSETALLCILGVLSVVLYTNFAAFSIS